MSDEKSNDLRDPAEEKRVPLTTEERPAEVVKETTTERVVEKPSETVVTTEDSAT